MRPRPKSSTELLRATVLLLALLLAAGALLKFIGDRSPRQAWWQDSADSLPHKKIAQIESPSSDATHKSAESAQRGGAEQNSLSSGRSRSRSGEGASLLPEPVQNAMRLVDQGRWNEAENLLAAYLKQNPQNEAGLVEMAMIQMLDKQDSAAAKPYLEKALEINPQNEVVVHELLRVYQDTRSWDEGLSYLQSLPAESPYVNFGIGSVLFEMNRPVEAAEVLHRTVYEAGYQDYDARETLAEALYAAGRGDEALQEFGKIAEGPYKPIEVRAAKVRMASVLMERGQTEDARGLLQGLQEADPSDEWVAYLMSQLGESRF